MNSFLHLNGSVGRSESRDISETLEKMRNYTETVEDRLTRAELCVPYACGVMDTNWFSRSSWCHISGVSSANWLKLEM